MASSDVVVVGGGVIGCSIAYHLAKRGASVTVLEREQLGIGSTKAAAGMLPPLAEASAMAPLLPLALESFRMLPSLTDELATESGITIDVQRTGIVRVALDEAQVKVLGSELARQRETGLRVACLDRGELMSLEPGV